MQTTGETKPERMTDGELMIYAGRGASWAHKELDRRQRARREA